MTTEWKQIYKIEIVDIYRSGWLGAWDSLVAAIKHKPRHTIKGITTFSLWVKTDQDVDIKIYGGQVVVETEKL
jgi:hypothetical protein